MTFSIENFIGFERRFKEVELNLRIYKVLDLKTNLLIDACRDSNQTVKLLNS